jgi:hypothetical protein
MTALPIGCTAGRLPPALLSGSVRLSIQIGCTHGFVCGVMTWGQVS